VKGKTELPKEVLHFGWWQRTLDLLRTIYGQEDLEQRRTALGTGFLWYNTPADPAASWVRSLFPLFSHENDPLVPAVLESLGIYDHELARPERNRPEDLLAMSQAIRSGYDAYLRLFQLSPWIAARLLTYSPERAEEYLPTVLSYCDTEQDPSRKASAILTLARVASGIPNWRERLLEGMQSGSREIAFACGMEMIRLDGDHASAAIVDSVTHASPGPEGRILFADCVRRTLPKIPHKRQISLLIRFLQNGTATDECHWIAKYLLGAAYGRITAISDARDMRFLKSKRWITFTWVGSPRTHDLEPPLDREQDWLAALLNASPLWRDDYPSSQGKEPKSNLYELFGLPSERAELASLWSKTHGKPWVERTT